MCIFIFTVKCTLDLTGRFIDLKIFVENMNSQTYKKINGVVYFRTKVVCDYMHGASTIPYPHVRINTSLRKLAS